MVTFFISGITSASFQDCEKSEDIIEALIFVSGPRMTGRQFFMMRVFTLSLPEAFFVGIDVIIFLTSEHETELNLNTSDSDLLHNEGWTLRWVEY